MHNDFVMTFILPVDGNEAEVEGKLSSGYSVYKNLLAEDPTPTSVYLPRFKIEAKSPIEVTEALGLSKGTSQIFHSAGMEIDEEGATGEAVTIVRTRGAGGPPTFYGNRPFYFSVFHRPTQTEIFFGYLGDPT